MKIAFNSFFDLLFNFHAEDSGEILNIINALDMEIQILPYTLGLFILGTFLLGCMQAYQIGIISFGFFLICQIIHFYQVKPATLTSLTQKN